MEMEFNWLALVVAAVIPTIVGSIWYGPLFGKPWMNSMGFTEEDLKKGNMPVIFGLSFVLAFILSFGLYSMITVSHGEAGSFGTFKHGFLHGAFLAIFFAIPPMVSGGLFERKNAKNLLINVGYWIVTFGLMGGLVDAWR